jgi:hypothetical protein
MGAASRWSSLGSALLGLAVGAFVTIAGEGSARAVGDPELDYWTLETTHFRVHYPSTLEPVARRVAELGERIHERIGPALSYVPKTRTEIAITDNTDTANGSATALPYNTIRLYATAPDDLSALGDYDDWYLALLTHEYAHIAHTDSISGVPAVVNVVLGKIYSPNQAQPRWLLEGLATMLESEHTSGGPHPLEPLGHVPPRRRARRSHRRPRSVLLEPLPLPGRKPLVHLRIALHPLDHGRLRPQHHARGLRRLRQAPSSHSASTARSAAPPARPTRSCSRASKITSSARTPSRCARSRSAACARARRSPTTAAPSSTRASSPRTRARARARS